MNKTLRRYFIILLTASLVTSCAHAGSANSRPRKENTFNFGTNGRFSAHTHSNAAPAGIGLVTVGILGIAATYNIYLIWTAYENAAHEYAQYFTLLNPKLTEDENTKLIKKAILSGQDGSNTHPLASFVKRLNSHLTYLDLSALFSRGHAHSAKIAQLKIRLHCLRKAIMNDAEYREEARNLALLNSIQNMNANNNAAWNHTVHF